jgi:tetratricopeptide (TPR) repeat protein
MRRISATILLLLAAGLAALPCRALAGNWFDRGRILFQSGHYDKAAEAFTKAIEGEPERTEAYVHRGASLFYLGRLEEAISDYNKVEERGAADADAYNNRGAAWYHLGAYDKAIEDTSRAIRLNPKHADAYCNRGTAWFFKGDFKKAIEDCTAALQVDNNHVLAMNQLAWTLSTCPDAAFRDGHKAVRWAKKALETHPEPSFLDTLAAAEAETGQYGDAVSTLGKLIAYLKEKGFDSAISEYEERLEAYQKRQPWREKALQALGGEDKGAAASLAVEKPAEAAPEEWEEAEEARPPSGEYPDSGDYFVQVGVYGTKEYAGQEARRLEKAGIPARVHPQKDARPAKYIVSIGRYAIETEARNAARKFTDRQDKGALVRPASILEGGPVTAAEAAPPAREEEPSEAPPNGQTRTEETPREDLGAETPGQDSPFAEEDLASRTPPKGAAGLEPETPPSPAAPPAPAVSGANTLADGAFFVAAGGDMEEKKARALARELENKGYLAEVAEKPGARGRARYTVSIGEYADWSFAKEAADAFKQLEGKTVRVEFRPPGPGGTHPAAWIRTRAPGESKGREDAFAEPVAVYRDKAHAEEHVRILKEKGHSPLLYEQRGQGNTTEYVVRVADYPAYLAALASEGEAPVRAAAPPSETSGNRSASDGAGKTPGNRDTVRRPPPAEDRPVETPPAARRDTESKARDPGDGERHGRSGGFVVQTGAFLDRENADLELSIVKKNGYPARIQVLKDAKGKVWHCVRFGEYPTAERAAEAARRFEKKAKRGAAARPAGSM